MWLLPSLKEELYQALSLTDIRKFVRVLHRMLSFIASASQSLVIIFFNFFALWECTVVDALIMPFVVHSPLKISSTGLRCF